MSPDGGANEDVERLGSLIRRLREDAGMSQGELAAAAERHQPRSHGGLDIGQISRWEREVRLIGPYWLPAMAEALGVPEERLRRGRAASKAARRRVRGPQPTGVDAVLRDLLPPDEPLAAVETRAGARVGMRDADRILRRAHALRLADDLVAGGDLVDAAMRELNAARELFNASSHSEPVGRRLLVGIAELAQLAGWVASDVTDGPDVARVFRLGAAAAREAEDRPLLGQLLGSWAYFETNRGHRSLGRDLALRLGAESGPEAPPRARSLVADRTAWCSVRAGDVQTALRAVGESAEALAEHEPGDDADRHWLYWVGDDERRIMEARVYTVARRPLRAVPLLREVLADYPADHTRELALYYSWLATSLLDGGEPEEAAAAAMRTLELSASVPSARAAARSEAVLTALRPHAAVPEVAEVLAEWGTPVA